jgi:phage-related protein
MGKRRWRDYKTAAGRRPVKEFLEALSDEDVARVTAAMKEVEVEGMRAARHLRNAIYEIRTDGHGVIYRVLFAPQGKRKQVVLALVPFKKKKTPKTPPQMIRLAERRLRDWERRGAELKREEKTWPRNPIFLMS